MTTKPKDKFAADTADTMASVGKETFETVVSMSAQAAAEGYKNAAQFGKEQLEATKTGYEKIAAFGKGNLEAYSAASAAALSGLESFYEEFVDYSKKAVAQNVDLMQKVAAAKTPQEMLELQFDAVNMLVNRSISENTKLNKIAADTAAKVAQPLKDRFDGNVSIFTKPLFG
jgi:phasin family protein